jgi:hypothetical protein
MEDIKKKWNFIFVTFMKVCREDPNLFKIGNFTWRPTYVLFPATLNPHKSAVFEWNVIGLLGWPVRYKDYAKAARCYVICTLPIFLLGTLKHSLRKQSALQELNHSIWRETANITGQSSTMYIREYFQKVRSLLRSCRSAFRAPSMTYYKVPCKGGKNGFKI